MNVPMKHHRKARPFYKISGVQLHMKYHMKFHMILPRVQLPMKDHMNFHRKVHPKSTQVVASQEGERASGILVTMGE